MARVASTRDTGEDLSETKAVSNYNDHRSEVEKPYNERKKRKGRNGQDTVDRKYHFTAEEKAAMIQAAAATGGVVNPLCGRVGAYWGQVEALIALGANQWHSLKKVRDKMESILSALPKDKSKGKGSVETNAWTDFYEKPTRPGAAKPKDGNGRIEQNFKVLQRLPKVDREENNPYGYKLAQFGMCIDIEYKVVEGSPAPLPYYRLNTTLPHDDTGMNTFPLFINPKGRKRSQGLPPQEIKVVQSEKAVDSAVDTLSSENISSSEFAEGNISSSPEIDIDAEQAAFDAEPSRVMQSEELVES